MKNKAISYQQVSYTYPAAKTAALSEVSLTLAAGESVAMIGENGAGKSTFAKLCCGLLAPSKGQVLMGEQAVHHLPKKKLARKIGYVFQNPDDQIFLATVKKELLYPAKEISDQRFFTEVVALCGLTDELDNHPYNLPWSVRKMVTIASVILQDPQCIIFDEPTAGQEKVGKDRLTNILAYLKEKAKTIILISHDMEFVAANFKRVIVMKNKQIVADSEVRDVFYNVPLLEEAKVKQPYIPELLTSIGLAELKLLTVEELIAYLQ